MLRILNERVEDDYLITEYTRDGKSVSYVIKIAVQPESSGPVEPIEPVEVKPTLEEVADATLLETQYQTVLIEMLAGF